MSSAGLPEGSMLSLFKSKTPTGTVTQPEDVAEAYDAGSVHDGDVRA